MAIPTDPQLANQWHLQAINLYTSAPGNPSVWDEYTGAGVDVGVYDNGVQANHFELDGNYDASLEVTFNGTVQNAQMQGQHGTSVAGIIAAEANGLDGVGVAYDADVAGVTLWVDGTTQPQWSPAFFNGILGPQTNFDVVNHSWQVSPFGWNPSNTSFQAVSAQMEASADNGRDGLGTIIVSAAGNDRTSSNQSGVSSDVNVNGAIAGSRFVVTVAGVGINGFVADYSNPGSNLLVSAPARGLWATAGNGIGGADKTDDANGTPGFQAGGADGWVAGSFANDLVGTSFAAPIVTGVVALMLQANPNLGWRDVKEILASSAKHTGSPVGSAPQNAELNDWFINGAHDWNGGGHSFSEDYGFGLIDAHAAVRLAETWGEQKTSANEVGDQSGFAVAPPDTIPDAGAPLVYGFNVSQSIITETVQIGLGITHPFAQDLEILLTSPSGTTTTLLGRRGGNLDVNGLRLTSNAFLGEDATGTWTLSIADRAALDVGTVSGAVFNVFGSPDSIDQTFVYTDEFSDYAGTMIRTFLDGHGGRDLLNAAAVTSASTIDLRGTVVNPAFTSTIDGTTVRILGGIEDAVTGDGADLIIGNGDANWLRGMRGADQLNGEGGADSLEGGVGADRLYAGEGFDTVLGQAGLDVVLGEGGNDFLNGGFANFLDSRGNDGNDVVSGGLGNDTVVVSLGNDNADGGGGFDFLSFAWTSQGFKADLTQTSTTFAAGGSWTNPGGNGGGAWAGLNTTTFSGFEALIGGLGNDTVIGNGAANYLAGGAADDVLRGAGGHDTLNGGNGVDVGSYQEKSGAILVTLKGATAANVVIGGAAEDVISNIERIWAGGGNDTLTGDSLANGLLGFAGRDSLSGQGGADNLQGGIGNDVLRGGLGNDTLYGGAGIDTADYTDKTAAVSVTLNGTSFVNVRVGGVIEDRMINVEQVFGGAANDTLGGDSLANWLSGGGGNDRLAGNAGNDTLIGGPGKDTLVGGANADQFRFNAVADSPAGPLRDVISDFQVGIDDINLAAIDGNANLAGKQNLFFKAGGFTGVAGQVIVQSGAVSFVFADVNGDQVQDFTIELTGNKALNAGDFIFV